jgi:hypothetical protein
MAQVIECLPSNWEALSLNPSTTKGKKKKKVNSNSDKMLCLKFYNYI